MFSKSLSVLLVGGVLTACGNGAGTSTPQVGKSAFDLQGMEARARAVSEQKSAALLAALPKGTRIYRIETMTFAVPGGFMQVPRASVVSYADNVLVYRLGDGTSKTVANATLIAQDRSRKTWVVPGKPVPVELRGQTPELVR